MYSRSIFFTLAAASITLVNADDPFESSGGICYAYGVDFIDEGSYFINSQSTEDFSAVTYFRGCNSDGEADVVLVAPEDTPGEAEFLCDKIPTTPENENQVSECPIKKSQMSSGHWLLLVLGDNGSNEDGKNGQPFAWQRDLYLTVGTPVTSTYTATVTDTKTETPTLTQTMTTTSTDVVTTGPFSTVIMPSGTAKRIRTVTPKAVTTTVTKTMTRTKQSWTRYFGTVTKTVQATCTTPAHEGKPDKPCQYSPTKVHAAAMETPTIIPKFHRWIRKGDREVDYEWARARVEAAKQRRAENAGQVERRAPDAPTTTVTYKTPVSVVATVTAPAITTTETLLQTASATVTLPPPTVLSGLLTSTTTLPTPTKTRSKYAWATTTKVITFGHTWTVTTTVTPTASVSACKKHGGHFWWH